MILDSGNSGGGEDESLVETKKIVVYAKEIRGEQDMENLEDQTPIKELVNKIVIASINHQSGFVKIWFKDIYFAVC